MKKILIILGISIFGAILVLVSLGGGSDYQEISAAELDSFMAENPNYQYIDVREDYEYTDGHVPGFVNQVNTDILNNNYDIEKDVPVVVMCRSGSRSSEVANYLAKNGFEVYNVSGGIMSYPGELEK